MKPDAFLLVALSATLCLASPASRAASDSPAPRPNIVMIFMDDMGHGDLSCYGSTRNQTPRIDRLAAEGIRFTNFYVSAGICAPSRGSLITGCYQPRNGVLTNGYEMRPGKYTFAELLRDAGYAAGMVGKWHVGEGASRPLAQGFGSYFGLPVSNDYYMPKTVGGVPTRCTEGMDAAWKLHKDAATLWDIPLYRNDEIIERPVNQVTLTDRYTDEAIQFIKANKEGPFFLYLAHAMVHVPLFVPDRFYDPDPHKAFSRTMAHVDESIGRVLDALDEEGLRDNTLVFFTSDNGPWQKFEHHAGEAGPLRGAKMSSFEGGIRMPAIARWPARIKSGAICDAIAGTVDLLPTFAELAGRGEPLPHKIDGISLVRLLDDPEAPSPRDFWFIWNLDELVGARRGPWKLLKGQLYNLSEDIGETTDVAAAHPEVVTELKAAMDKAYAEMQADVTAEIGKWQNLRRKD